MPSQTFDAFSNIVGIEKSPIYLNPVLELFSITHWFADFLLSMSFS